MFFLLALFLVGCPTPPPEYPEPPPCEERTVEAPPPAYGNRVVLQQQRCEVKREWVAVTPCGHIEPTAGIEPASHPPAPATRIELAHN
jgi:hypothetical protein